MVNKKNVKSFSLIDKDKELKDETNSFDELFNRISSPDSMRAVDALFSANTNKLKESYTPGNQT
jgi:hypothetical protein